jgi:hypothetical protein
VTDLHGEQGQEFLLPQLDPLEVEQTIRPEFSVVSHRRDAAVSLGGDDR